MIKQDKYCVYLIFNNINGKVYVGKTKNYKKRINRHKNIATDANNESGSLVHRAIKKYGIDNFTFCILQTFGNEKDCFAAEIYWVRYYKSNATKYGNEFGYNLTEGGEGPSGAKRSKDTKKKQSLNKLGKKRSEEDRKKMSIGRSGMILSQSHKDNMSKSRTGMYQGGDNNFFGQHHSDESLKKISGENNGLSKLTEQSVIEIRNKYNSNNYTQQSLSIEYNVSPGTIQAVVSRKTWRNI